MAVVCILASKHMAAPPFTFLEPLFNVHGAISLQCSRIAKSMNICEHSSHKGICLIGSYGYAIRLEINLMLWVEPQRSQTLAIFVSPHMCRDLLKVVSSEIAV